MKNEIVYSTCGEVFNYDSISDFDVGDIYFSGKKVEIKPGELVHKWTVDNIVEQMEEQLFEVVGDVAEGNFHLSEDDNKELQEIIVKFMNEKAKVTCYSVDEIQEHILSIDDLS